MASCSYLHITMRTLRRVPDVRHRPPYLMKSKSGLNTTGPVHFAEWSWPTGDPSDIAQQFSPNQHSVSYGANEFSNLSPKIKHDKPWLGMPTYNIKELRDYTGVQELGYTDPQTKKFTMVPEMKPELVVPDLTGFQLKPYVSFKANAAQQKLAEDLDKLIEENDGEISDDVYWEEFLKESQFGKAPRYWPPPKISAKQLFNWHYAPKIKEQFLKGEFDEVLKIKKE